MEQNNVDPGQHRRILVLVMKNKNNKAPATAQEAALTLVSPYTVDLGHDMSQQLDLADLGEQKKYESLQAKYPVVHDALKQVALGVIQTADKTRHLLQVIVSADMKHEESSLMLKAWGYGRDRISMVHRVADAAPKTREAYLKGDFGLKRAVLEARAEDDGMDGEGSRGGKRGAKKPGGTKEQRAELFALAEYVGKEIKAFKPSKNPIKTEWVRLGSDPWQVMIVVRHKPLAPEPGEETAGEGGEA